MSLRYIRHLGMMNPDHIQAVKAMKARFSYGDVARYKDGPKKGHPRAHRQLFTGKPQRPYLDPFGGTRRRAHVNVWHVGDTYPMSLDDTTDGDAKRQAQEIMDDLRAPLATETIVAAAVRLPIDQSDTEWTHKLEYIVMSAPAPARHHHVVQANWALHGVPIGPHEQGFLTSTGRYVDRKEAFLIALASGQLKPDKVKQADRRVTPDLFSEDLW